MHKSARRSTSREVHREGHFGKVPGRPDGCAKGTYVVGEAGIQQRLKVPPLKPFVYMSVVVIHTKVHPNKSVTLPPLWWNSVKLSRSSNRGRQGHMKCCPLSLSTRKILFDVTAKINHGHMGNKIIQIGQKLLIHSVQHSLDLANKGWYLHYSAEIYRHIP